MDVSEIIEERSKQMNLKEGMKVRVKSMDKLFAIEDIFPNIIDCMFRRAGEIITVSYIVDNNPYTVFRIKEDSCLWSELMIEPVIELDIDNDEFIKLLGGEV